MKSDIPVRVFLAVHRAMQGDVATVNPELRLSAPILVFYPYLWLRLRYFALAKSQTSLLFALGFSYLWLRRRYAVSAMLK